MKEKFEKQRSCQQAAAPKQNAENSQHLNKMTPSLCPVCLKKIDAKKQKWTFDRLWEVYQVERTPGKSLQVDTGRYKKYVQPILGDKQPVDVTALDIQKIKRSVKHLSLQTQRQG